MIIRNNDIKGENLYFGLIRDEILDVFEMAIFEDGLIYAPDALGLTQFREKLFKLNYNTPTDLNIHGLGRWKYKKLILNLTIENYYKFIEDEIKKLNPMLDNLIDSTNEKNYYPNSILYTNFNLIIENYENSYSKFEKFSLFLRKGKNDFALCTVYVFDNGELAIQGFEKNQLKIITIREFEGLIKSGKFTSSLPLGSLLFVDNFGIFEIKEKIAEIEILEKFKEINDIISRLNNQPTSSQICVDNYNSYLTNPSKENKEKLSKSYQQVPKQVRKFILGDMDLKDGPILEIINRSNAD